MKEKQPETNNYQVIITKSSAGFFAYTPDLPGCTATAHSREAVTQKIKKAIQSQVNNPTHPPKKHAAHLRGSTHFLDIGIPGPLIRQLFDSISNIPGWFNVDDCSHFHLVLSLQSALGLTGDLFEIGSYHGRSTSMMAGYLQPDEKIVVCDVFEAAGSDNYRNKPSPEQLLANITRINKNLNTEQVVIHKCLSTALQLDKSHRFRFVHVDGGHSADAVYYDLNLSKRYLVDKGVMVVDDYDNINWPGVTRGTDQFLQENSDIRILADLNRHGAVGRKLYLIKQAGSAAGFS